MSKTPPLFVRVSTEAGHFSVPAAIAARAGSDWSVLQQDAVDRDGRPLASKPRTEIASKPAKRKSRKAATTKPRATTDAATPTPTEPEAVASDVTV